MDAWQKLQDKVLSWDAVPARMGQWKTNNAKIVFTNGCFDLLHYGHIHYLTEARALGTHLVVGLNSDASVSRLKGEHRPIKDEQNRSMILAALACVDAVVIFTEDTPLQLIELLSPDVLVKGGDWAPEQIVGNEWVKARGGEVLSLQFIEGYSTSALEEKIKGS